MSLLENTSLDSGSRGPVLWRTEIGRAVLTQPVVTSNLVMVVGLSQSKQGKVGFLYSLDRLSGIERWSFTGRAGSGLKGGIRAAPLVAGNFTYFGSGDGKVWRLDLGLGAVQWETEVSGSVLAAPAIHEDQIFVADENGGLTALNVNTGQYQWSFQTAGAIWTRPHLREGVVITSSWDGNLYALDLAGKLIWKKEIAPLARPTAMAANDDLLILFDSARGELIGFVLGKEMNRSEIEQKWRFPTAQRTEVTPLLSGNSVCFASSANELLTCLDASTGTVHWTNTVASNSLSPTIYGDDLIFASRDGQVSAVNLRSGAEQWKIETGLSFGSEPVVADGVLYIGGTNRSLYALTLDEQRG